MLYTARKEAGKITEIPALGASLIVRRLRKAPRLRGFGNPSRHNLTLAGRHVHRPARTFTREVAVGASEAKAGINGGDYH